MKLFFLLMLLFSNFLGAQTPSALPVPEGKQYSRIWLRSRVAPMNFNWDALGLSQESSFTGPLNAAWKKWLAENLPANVVDAEVCTEACAVAFDKWEDQSLKQIMASPDPAYAGGVWLKVDLDITKDGPTQYHWQGRAVLLDINTKRPLGSFFLGKEARRFPEDIQVNINSALANQLYRTTLSAFLQLTKTLGKTSPLDKVAHVKINGHKTLSDVLDLVKLIQTRGEQLGLLVSMEEFGTTGATLLCLFRGEEKTFNDLLSQLKELKSSHSYTLVNQSTAPDYVLQLVTE